MDQFPQRAVIGSKGIGPVKASRAAGAEGAQSMIVERKRVGKWRMTTGAKIFREQRFRSG
jgi:hypothetical protein